MVDPVVTPPVTPPVVSPVTPPGDPWYKGIADLPPEYVGKYQTLGLHTKTAAEAAVALTKSFMEAEKFIGAPASQIIRMPKDAADEQGWLALRTRMGVPTDPKQYEEGIKTVKLPDGKDLDAGYLDFSRDLAAKLHLPATDAPEVARAIVARDKRISDAANADKAAALAASKAELAKSWGANEAGNRLIAQNAATRLGIDAAAVTALEGVVGYNKVMEMFLNLGTRMGEDKFVTGAKTGIGPNGALSKEQANSQLAELKADKAFVAKYLDGDREARRQMDALHQLIAA